MAINVTSLGAGQDADSNAPWQTSQSFNPPAAGALAVLVAAHSSTPAQISLSGCKATWTKKCQFSLGDYGCCVFLGTGATTNQPITVTSSGDIFAIQYQVSQITADGTLSFPANDSESSGNGTALSVAGLAALGAAANRAIAMFFLESLDGVTPGTNFTEVYDGFPGVAHAAFVEVGTTNSNSPTATALVASNWGGGAFEIAEAGGGGGSHTEPVTHAQAAFQGQTIPLRYSAALIAAQAVMNGSNVGTIHGGSVIEPVAGAEATWEGQQVPFEFGFPRDPAEAAWEGGELTFRLRWVAGFADCAWQGQNIPLLTTTGRTEQIIAAQAVFQPSIVNTVATGLPPPSALPVWDVSTQITWRPLYEKVC